MRAIIAEDGAHVVEFVGGGNQPRIRIFSFQARNVFLFALAPRRLGIGVGIGTAVDHFCDAGAEPAANFFQHGGAAAIFDHVVQKSGDGQIFVAASL